MTIIPLQKNLNSLKFFLTCRVCDIKRVGYSTRGSHVPTVSTDSLPWDNGLFQNMLKARSEVLSPLPTCSSSVKASHKTYSYIILILEWKMGWIWKLLMQSRSAEDELVYCWYIWHLFTFTWNRNYVFYRVWGKEIKIQARLIQAGKEADQYTVLFLASYTFWEAHPQTEQLWPPYRAYHYLEFYYHGQRHRRRVF